jgi:hypothetical protein
LAAVLLVAAGLLFVAAIGIGLLLDRSNPDKIGLEAAKALVTLAAGLLLGGGLKIATDKHAADKLARDEAAKRFDALIADMHHNHDRLETARLLIAAHRSARTYGERMREVIDAHVVLLKIARLPGMGVLEHDPHDVDHLENMLAYLVALQVEYQHNYKKVSDLQRYDEEVTKQHFADDAKCLLAQGDGVDHVPPQPSERAWDLLHSSRMFPVLDDLCDRGTEYQKCFLDSCAALNDRLAKAKASGRLSATPPEPSRLDPQFIEKVKVKADAIRERCSERAESGSVSMQLQP